MLKVAADDMTFNEISQT